MCTKVVCRACAIRFHDIPSDWLWCAAHLRAYCREWKCNWKRGPCWKCRRSAEIKRNRRKVCVGQVLARQWPPHFLRTVPRPAHYLVFLNFEFFFPLHPTGHLLSPATFWVHARSRLTVYYQYCIWFFFSKLK
jgi:hypothetical protein